MSNPLERTSTEQSLSLEFIPSENSNVDSRSKNEIIQDVFMKTSINALHNTSMQCTSNVMRGLQGIIPGHCTNVEVTPVAGGKKVSISIQQARKNLKGQRKNPPEMPSHEEYAPPTSNFVCNARNHAHSNWLSRVEIDPRRETAAMTTTAVVLRSPAMMERIQIRVLDKVLDNTTTPQTKRVVAKVHAQLAHKDATFTTVVERFQNIQSSQEISDAASTFSAPWTSGA